MPIQVKGGKEPEVAHEVDSQENGHCVEVDRSNENEIKSMGIPFAVCLNKLKEEKSLKCHMKWNHNSHCFHSHSCSTHRKWRL